MVTGHQWFLRSAGETQQLFVGPYWEAISMQSEILKTMLDRKYKEDINLEGKNSKKKKSYSLAMLLFTFISFS